MPVLGAGVAALSAGFIEVAGAAGADGEAGDGEAGCVWANAGAMAVEAMRMAAAAIVLRVFFITNLPS